MRESCTYGSVRGARSNARPYRDPQCRLVMAVRQRQPLDRITHAGLFLARRRGLLLPVISGAAHSRLKVRITPLDISSPLENCPHYLCLTFGSTPVRQYYRVLAGARTNPSPRVYSKKSSFPEGLLCPHAFTLIKIREAFCHRAQVRYACSLAIRDLMVLFERSASLARSIFALLCTS
jgi:hypothetical protein